MGFNCLKATATSRRQFTFYHYVPRNFWYSFYRPRKDERLSQPWSHPVILNTEALDWESSVLTTMSDFYHSSLNPLQLGTVKLNYLFKFVIKVFPKVILKFFYLVVREQIFAFCDDKLHGFTG